MSDSFSGKNGKVKVMYVRSDENNDNKRKGSTNERHNKRNTSSNQHPPKVARWGDSERPRRPTRGKHEKAPHSPWQAKLQDVSEPDITDSSVTTPRSVSAIDPAQLRRQRDEETKVYGENACQSLFLNRSDSIVRAYFLQDVTPRFRDALKWMAVNRKAYHVVDMEEMQKVSGTEHHGGVCFLIKKRTGVTVSQYLSTVRQKDCILAIEGVGNPHNLGGIMRSAAYFGVNGLLVRDVDALESGAAVRTAEGGAEHLEVIASDDLAVSLDTLHRAGYSIIAIAPGQGTGLNQITLPAKTVLVISEERGGLVESVRRQVEMNVSIPGVGKISGLNLSVATGIILSQWWYQNLTN